MRCALKRLQPIRYVGGLCGVPVKPNNVLKYEITCCHRRRCIARHCWHGQRRRGCVKPKPPGSALVLTMSGGKIVDATAVEAATTGEIVIKPKSSDSAVVLTISGGKLVKASIRAKPEPEPMGEPAPVKDTVVFARTP